MKRERWTEGDVDALPAGEHDYFERKSGQLFADTDALLGKLAKTVSALANSSGGYIVLGVNDAGIPDGVPPMRGKTSTREWLEQKISQLVAYPLADFRVHVAEPSTPSRIPAGSQVIVVDIGDSALAPHQCLQAGGGAIKHLYYYRQAGHSVPAPHFYLELLRQRLVAPALTADLVDVLPIKARRAEGGVFVALHLRFQIKNVGRVAAYKWQLQITEYDGHQADRVSDYRFGSENYPPGCRSGSSVRFDYTILPGCTDAVKIDLGVVLRPNSETDEAVRAEIEKLLATVVLGVRLATEVSPGELKHVELRSVLDVQRTVEFALADIKKGPD